MASAAAIRAPRIGEQRADRCEAAAPEDPRRRARRRARRAARVRGSAPADAPSGNSPSAAPAAPAASSATPRRARRKAAPRVGERRRPVRRQSLPNGDARAAAAGGPDPFTGPARRSRPPRRPPAALPKQIVIGRPGGHRVAKRGWIVILASIPTNNGRGAASRFARSARGTSARSPSSTRRIAGRCAAATGSSTPARTRRWRRSHDAQATSMRPATGRPTSAS